MTATGNGQGGLFGDTTLTKVFVGGLAWETPVDKLRSHFEKFGDILEAVIISDNLSARSKGYGFVTFKEAEAARKACEDPAPIINGRRANCNLAALGSRRSKMSPTPPPPPVLGKPRLAAAPPPGNGHWYFPVGTLPAASQFHHHHPQAVPFYGCSPAYIAANYNHVSWNGGMNYPQAQQMYSRGTADVMRGPPAAANTWMMMMPPLYYHPHHYQPQPMGLQAHPSGPIIASGPIVD